jgi:hypothetical protein
MDPYRHGRDPFSCFRYLETLSHSKDREASGGLGHYAGRPDGGHLCQYLASSRAMVDPLDRLRFFQNRTENVYGFQKESFMVRRYLRIFVLCLIPFLMLVIRSSSVFAICPHPEPRVQTLLTRCDAGFIGTIISEQHVTEKDGGEINDGAIYTFRVEKTFQGPERDFIEVYDEFGTESLVMDVGHKLLIFAKRNNKGKLQVRCGDGFDEKWTNYEKSVQEAQKVLKNIKAGKNGDISGFVGQDQDTEEDPIPGIHFIVTGNGRTYRVVSDETGWFHLSVPPGHYQIKPSDTNWIVKLTDYCWENSKDLDVRIAGGADLGFIATLKNK